MSKWNVPFEAVIRGSVVVEAATRKGAEGKALGLSNAKLKKQADIDWLAIDANRVRPARR